MKQHIASALALAALLAAAAPAFAAATPAAPRTAVVTCQIARLYLFATEDNRPTGIDLARGARQGQQLEIVSGPRITLGSNDYYETAIPIVEVGTGLVPHYFISGACISLTP